MSINNFKVPNRTSKLRNLDWMERSFVVSADNGNAYLYCMDEPPPKIPSNKSDKIEEIKNDEVNEDVEKQEMSFH